MPHAPSPAFLEKLPEQSNIRNRPGNRIHIPDSSCGISTLGSDA
ncbi:hypothetical protein [Desmonostoc muscorum]|nr:hypothetical protein [Desmonostoc muscorum]